MTQEQKIIAYKKYCELKNKKESSAKALNEFYDLFEETKFVYYIIATDKDYLRYCKISSRPLEHPRTYNSYIANKKYIALLDELEKSLDQLEYQFEYELKYGLKDTSTEELERFIYSHKDMILAIKMYLMNYK